MTRPNLFPRPATTTETVLLTAMAQRAFADGHFRWAASICRKLADLCEAEEAARDAHFLAVRK